MSPDKEIEDLANRFSQCQMDYIDKKIQKYKNLYKFYKKKFHSTLIELENVKNKLEQLKLDGNKYVIRGKNCSVSGGKYEKKVHQIIRHAYMNDKLFNTQNEKELAGSSYGIDLECNMNNIKDIGIEVKKHRAPDWVQCSLKYNYENKKWEASKQGKIPQQAKEIFNKFLANVNLYNGKIPPIEPNKLTHSEWLKLKKEENVWGDKYIKISDNAICELYKLKGCHYIQISEYGLYHLGSDVCEFGIPKFEIDQQIRIRIKVHTRKNKKGFCKLSVMASCQPINISQLKKSNCSLDNEHKLPEKLTYKIEK